MATKKRKAPSSPTPPVPSVGWEPFAKHLVLTRSTLASWAASRRFPKLVRQGFVRIRHPSERGKYAVFAVARAGKPASKPYEVEGVTTRAMLEVVSPVLKTPDGRLVASTIPVASVSGQQATEGEVAPVLAALADSPAPMSFARLSGIRDDRDRILADKDKISRVGDGVPWGTPAKGHFAHVVLRSWTAPSSLGDEAGCTAPVAVLRPEKRAPPPPPPATGRTEGELSMAAAFVPCLEAEGEEPGKFKGGYVYLLWHRGDHLETPCVEASPYDEDQPDITASRLLGYLGRWPAASLRVIRRAILAQMDLGVEGPPAAAGGGGDGGSGGDGGASTAPFRQTVTPHQVLLLDTELMSLRGSLPAEWWKKLKVPAGSTSIKKSVFPTGYALVPESLLREAASAGSASYGGVPLSPRVVALVRQHGGVAALLPPRWGSHVKTLFHGTTPERVAALRTMGFLRPKCRDLEACREGNCECQMLGFGVYLAERAKALEFAVKRAVFDEEQGAPVGALLEVEVDLGHLKTATSERCPHGCGKEFVDHIGSWNLWQGYDSLYVTDGSMPAARVREWCVADPSRITIKNVTYHKQ